MLSEPFLKCGKRKKAICTTTIGHLTSYLSAGESEVVVTCAQGLDAPSEQSIGCF